MSSQEELIRKLYRTVSLVGCESRLARSYGTAHELTPSDMDFLKCVERKADAKAGDISLYLGVTNGATTQLAGKLEQKGYIEPYRQAGNRKEVFYRLTDSGRAACRGFDEHYEKIKREVAAYLGRLDDAALLQIDGLLDVMAENLDVGEYCSVRHGENQSESPLSAGGKKCEKCRKLY